MSHIEKLRERWERERNVWWLTPEDVDALFKEIANLESECAELGSDVDRLDQNVRDLRDQMGAELRVALGGMKL